jgi:hypothetical protein
VNGKHFAPRAVAALLGVTTLAAQDAKFAAENLKYSRDFYSKVHFVAIANLSFGSNRTAQFKYDRYPNGGPERIQTDDGEFARVNAKTWLKSNDWGKSGKPADAQTSTRLNNWVALIDAPLHSEAGSNGASEGATELKLVGKKDTAEREEFIFEEAKENAKANSAPRLTFHRFKNDEGDHALLSGFSGPMRRGQRNATAKITYSYLVAVKIEEAAAESPSPREKSTASALGLLDGKLKIDIPPDFVREPNDPKDTKTVARFTREGEGGAWGAVLRGTHGLTPEQLPDYLKIRVEEYSKGFKWLPKDSHLQWLRKEIVTIDGRKWADWRFVPMLKGKKDYRNNPVYTRFLTTSYHGQLLEINFTTNLNTEPELKAEIDHIMDSVHLEE